MTHIGQELALGAAGGLGFLLGLPQFAVGTKQFRGARFHLLFQLVPMFQKLLVPLLNFRQHAVEAIDQLPHLVIGSLHGARSIIFLGGDDLSCSGEVRNGLRNDALKPGRKRKCQQGRRQKHDHSGSQKSLQAHLDFHQIGFQIDGANGLLGEHDTLEKPQPVVFKPAAIGPKARKRTLLLSSVTKVDGKELPVGGIQGCGHHRSLSPQGA